MTSAVPDTNIVISALFWQGAPHEVVRRGLLGQFGLVTSNEIIDEVSGKLRGKFGYPEEEIAQVVDIMLALFHVVSTSSTFREARDAKDDKVLACAVDGRADFIVTGDSDLLVLKEFRGVKIATAKEFLEKLPKEQ